MLRGHGELDQVNYQGYPEFQRITITGNNCFNNKFVQIEIHDFEIDTGRYNLYYNKWSHMLIAGQHGACYSESDNFKDWCTSNEYVGFCSVLNFDVKQNIISGVFEFQAYREDDLSEISVTDGRFDIKFNNRIQ